MISLSGLCPTSWSRASQSARSSLHFPLAGKSWSPTSHHITYSQRNSLSQSLLSLKFWLPLPAEIWPCSPLFLWYSGESAILHPPQSSLLLQLAPLYPPHARSSYLGVQVPSATFSPAVLASPRNSIWWIPVILSWRIPNIPCPWKVPVR